MLGILVVFCVGGMVLSLVAVMEWHLGGSEYGRAGILSCAVCLAAAILLIRYDVDSLAEARQACAAYCTSHEYEGSRVEWSIEYCICTPQAGVVPVDDLP